MGHDLYGNSIAAYKTGTYQIANLLLNTICLAMKQKKKKAAVSCNFTAAGKFSTFL